jgi:thiamine transporter
MNNSTKVIAEVAIMIALAFIIELIFIFIPGMLQGGRISISLLPILVLSWRRGIIPGMISGLLFSLMNMFLLDGYNPALLLGWGLTMQDFYASVALDYILAFSLVGLAGLVRKLSDPSLTSFALTIIVGYTIRFLMHFLSGIIIFGSFAGEQNVWIYSIVYNGTYMLPSLLLATIVGIALYKRVILQLDNQLT